MAKKRLSIAPKLQDKKVEVQALPVQKISAADIEEMAKVKEPQKKKTISESVVTKERSDSTPNRRAKKRKPVSKQRQGRPRREEEVRRLSSDLPADLYLKVKKEVKNNGYTLNGFLAKVIREYFDRKEK